MHREFKKEEVDFTRYTEEFFHPDLSLEVKRRHVRDNAKGDKGPIVHVFDAKRGKYIEGRLEFNKNNPEEYLLTDIDSPGSEEATLTLRYENLTSLLVKKTHMK